MATDSREIASGSSSPSPIPSATPPPDDLPSATPEDPERIASQAALRRRTLSDVARDLRSRGDRVVLSVGGRRFTGVVPHAAGDLVTLDVAGGRVHAAVRHLDFLRVVEPGATAGAERTAGPSSFKAQLFELELEGRTVTCGAEGLGDDLRVVIVAVGVDHLLLRDGDDQEWAVPTNAVAYVLDHRDED